MVLKIIGLLSMCLSEIYAYTVPDDQVELIIAQTSSGCLFEVATVVGL